MTAAIPFLTPALVAVLSLSALLVPAGTPPAAAPVTGATPLAPPPTTFMVDNGHSSVHFRIWHLQAANVYGRFNKVSGKIVLDDANLAAATIEVEVDAASVDSNNPDRDKHLKSQDFLNVKQFPTVTFKSRSVKKAGKSSYEVAGDLTLHGVTKPITVAVEATGAGQVVEQFGYRIGFETTFTIKRSDFGLNWGLEQKILGDEVRLTLAIEAAAVK